MDSNEPINTGEIPDGRNPDGTFAAGNNINPAGKPRGARHKVTRAIEELLEGEHEALTRTAIDKAKAGDMAALRLCLERLAPPRKDAPISVELPPIATAEDTAAASAAVLAQLAAGEITPGEAGAVMALLVSHKTIIETGELERRIGELEARNGK